MGLDFYIKKNNYNSSVIIVCVHFIHERHFIQFKVDLERQTFSEKLFKAILFFSQRFCQNLLRSSCQRIIFFLYFDLLKMCDLGLNRGLISNKPTHFLLDNGGSCLFLPINLFMWQLICCPPASNLSA